jgi:MSHA biogenesis protein MshJ
MTAAVAYRTLVARFDRLSLRERVFVSVALLAGLIMLWDTLLMKPLSLRKTSLSQRLAAEGSGLATDSGAAADLTDASLQRLLDLQRELKSVDAQFASAAAGLIPPDQMVQVIHDVLSRQHGIKLVSLQSQPVRSLMPALSGADSGTPPYVHPVELVIEGSYLEVLSYLRELEALPWRFYWKTLDLQTRRYPVNRVRIEACTVSMDKAWLGV